MEAGSPDHAEFRGTAGAAAEATGALRHLGKTWHTLPGRSVQVAGVSKNGLLFARTAAEAGAEVQSAASRPPGSVRFLFPQSGTTSLRSSWYHGELAPGDLVVFDAAAGFELEVSEPAEWFEIIVDRVTPLQGGDARRVVTARACKAPPARHLLVLASAVLDMRAPSSGREWLPLIRATRALAYGVCEQFVVAPATRGQRLFLRAIAVIQEKASDVSLSVSALAGHLRVSPRTLHRAFHDEGTTVLREIAEARRELALLLADGGDRTDAAVAEMAGFPSARAMRSALRAAGSR